MALGKLKMVHSQILREKPIFHGSPERKQFCGQQSSKLYNFAFRKLYTDLLTAVEHNREDMDPHYKGFFCMMCDAKNHPFMKYLNKSITLNGEFCRNTLTEHNKVLRLINIKLINYL